MTFKVNIYIFELKKMHNMLSKRFLFCQKFGLVDDAKQKKK